MKRVALAVLCAVLLSTVWLHSSADTAGLELLPSDLAAAPNDAEIVVSGTNGLDHPAVIVLRIDDAASDDYWSRVNLERKVPPGPFVFRIPVAALKTVRHRLIDRQNLRLAKLFASPADPKVIIDRAVVEAAIPIHDPVADILAFDFGPDGSAIFPGFAAVTPTHPMLVGKRLRTRERPSGDALIADGIEGVERLVIQHRPGLWQITLWTEDLGEWEYLPHALERRIRVNGQTALYRRLSPQQWRQTVYLAGRSEEWRPGKTAWDGFGARRGGMLEHIVDTADGRIEIEFAGSDLSTTFVSGLILTPVGNSQIARTVETERRKRFNETWRFRIQDTLSELPENGFVLSTSGSAIAAPGTLAHIEITALSGKTIASPSPGVAAPARDGTILPAILFAGHWRLTRPETASTLLVADDRHLRGDTADLPIHAGLPRRYTVVVQIPENSPAGLYKGHVSISGQTQPFSVKVLDIALPKVDKAVGLYLDDLPLHRWFRNSPATARLCDLSTLRSIGLTGIAPPLTAPFDENTLKILSRDIQIVRLGGFSGPLLGYAPLKRLREKQSWAKNLRRAQASLEAAGETVYWSAADEVSNEGHDLDAFRAHIEEIRRAAPTARIAGHFNAERDRKIAPLFDMALINSGYGLTPDAINALKRKGTKTYLYNLGHTRLAAGAFLWKNELDGYLQWHARMPTADPFDPTDGREADVQWLYPTAEECPRAPDIDRSLLDMADGIIDLRWLLWLDQQASQNATALALREDIKARLTGDWITDKHLTKKDLSHLRARIQDLAQNLRTSG